MMETTGSRVLLLSSNTRRRFPIAGQAGCYGLTYRLICIMCAVFVFTFIPPSWCFSSGIVLIRSSDNPSLEQRELEFAARFYGVNLEVVTASDSNKALVLGAIRKDAKLAVAIEAGALNDINPKAFLQALHRERAGSIPLLVFAITPDVDQVLLRQLSGGAVTGSGYIKSLSGLHYVVGRVAGLTQQLTNVDLSISGNDISYFYLTEHSHAQVIISAQDNHQAVPIFLEADLGQQKVFLLCNTLPNNRITDTISESMEAGFAKIAPVMMFVKFSAGERGWHALHYYANLTIDDPWLREPYGNLSYVGLLEEMEKHEFHTTIAFIPWNYDRSQADVVSLFRNHPNRFSIAIHGDNHDHKEFTDYRSKSLAAQVDDLKQALSRMESFQKLTGIPYDKVMIFPHSIAPKEMLGALKTYNYSATVNSSNVPQNITRPTNMSEAFRPVTLLFDGFPSISRYSTAVQVPEAYVAMNQFLGNPLFFYDHSELFSQGIGAFDPVADEVNRLEPATEWRSLGEIVRHLYVVKLRNDSNYDVQSFSSNICLENGIGRSSIFYVQKQEIGGQTIASVTVDGITYPYSFQKGQISLDIPVPLGGTRCISIQYANDLELNPIGPKHDSIVVYLLRMGSDFRDIYLAKSSAGLVAIHFYNKHGLKPAKVVGYLVLFLATLIYACFRLWISVKKRFQSNHQISPSLTN